MNLKQIAQKLGGYIQSKTQDDEGWVRGGKLTPIQQVQQMGQNLSAWGNIANQGIKNQVEIQKRDFDKYTWQPLKQNPVLAPTLNRFEEATPAIGNQLRQLNPFAPKQTPQQNWQDTKKIGAAALTAYGLAKAPLSAVLGGAAISPLIKLGTNVYENKKGEELNKQLSQYGQSRTDVPLFAQQTPYQNKPITQGIPESIFEGAGQGLANAGTTRLTNSLVGYFSGSVPFLNKLTEESIKKGTPVVTDTLKQGTQKFFNTAGKRLIKAAVLETAVESPIWATFTQSEQETYLEALQRETIQNLEMNIGMAGVQSLGDARSLTPIIKKSVDDAVTNYFKNASSPENLRKQGGYIDFMGNTIDGTERTNRFNNLVDTYYKPNATVEEKYNAFAEIRRLAGDIFSKEKIAKLNIGDNRDPENLIMALSDVINKDIKTNRGYQEPFTIRNFLANKELQRGGMDLTDKTKPFPQSPLSPESKGIIKLKDNDLVKTFDETIKTTESPKVKVSSMAIEQPELKQRGFSASVQEAPNVSKKVKTQVLGGYESKPNDVLMGEAKALLTEGGQIDFKNTKDIDKKVAATMQEAINQQKAGNHKAAADLFNNLSEQGTELGRGVQAFSLLKNMSPEAIALSAAGKIKKYNQTAKVKIPELTGEQVKAISDKVAEADLLKGEERNKALFEINQLINEFIPSSLSDKALTVWKAGLLTSFRTHIRNFVGNTVHGVAETIKDIPATIADIGLSAKTGKRTITPTIKGTSEAWSKDTVEQMRSILGSGYDPDKIIQKFDIKQITWGKNLVEKGLKAYTDTVFRLLGASDKPFYNAAMARSLYSQAGAEAINQGMRGNKAFIDNLVKNPTEEMIKIAIGDANVATFKDRNKAVEIAGALKRAMSTTKAGKVISEVTMPFTGVPGSVLGQIISYSPAGLIKGSIDAGRVSLGNMPELQRQAAQEIGRGVIGTGIFGLGSYLMSKGLMTGQPKDQEEQRQWELENKPRNSIMIGGKWRSLNSIGPEAVVFLAGSKLNQELNSEEGNIGTYGVKLGKDYLDQSFVQGLQGPVNAITDPNRYAKSYIGNQLSSVVPNIVKDVSKATDPYQREANTITDYAKQGIPGARQTLTERRDVLGNVMPQEPTGGAAFVDIFNSKTPISNTVANELSRLYESGSGATPSKLSSSQTILKQKVKLTAEQLNDLEAGVGEELKPKLDTLISSPVYAKLDDEKKAKAIDKLVQDTRDKYKTKNAGQFGVSSNVKVTPIEKPKYTGNATADKKLKTQYENAVEKQQTDLLKTESPESDVREYIDEDGNYKTVDLSPIEYPEMTGNTVVDKKLKSSYYSSINAQINDVIKLYKAGQIDQTELTKLVTALDTQYNKGKTKKAKKIAFKVSSPKALPKITLKISSPTASKLKLKSAPKIKLSKTDNRKYTIKA